MKKITKSQKFLLILFSVFFTLVILEGILRVGGAVFTFFQEKQNVVTFKGDEFRILCIGESTTAIGGGDSYPSQLEAILKKSRPDKEFHVINKGMVSKTSKDVLEQLEGFLDKYKPHCVISMLGINDREGMGQGSPFIRFLKSMRAYQFLKRLSTQVGRKMDTISWERSLGDKSGHLDEKDVLIDLDKIEGADSSSGNIEKIINSLIEGETFIKRLEAVFLRTALPSERKKIRNQVHQLKIRQSWLFVRLGRYRRTEGSYKEAEYYLKMAIAQFPDNYGAYVELGRCQKERKRYKEAIILFQKATEVNKHAVVANIELARAYKKIGAYAKTFEIYKKVLGLEPKERWVKPEIGRWLLEHDHLDDAESVLTKAIEESPGDYALYECLAQVYLRKGKQDQAASFYEKSRTMKESAEAYLPATAGNYNDIADIILSRGIRLICMQYPLRDVEPLKKIFLTKRPIIFVENKNNFKGVLKKSGYSEVFSDSFAGYFGHCTRKGNRLIAQNLANTILDKIIKK